MGNYDVSQSYKTKLTEKNDVWENMNLVCIEIRLSTLFIQEVSIIKFPKLSIFFQTWALVKSSLRETFEDVLLKTMTPLEEDRK